LAVVTCGFDGIAQAGEVVTIREPGQYGMNVLVDGGNPARCRSHVLHTLEKRVEDYFYTTLGIEPSVSAVNPGC
jgi:hypothetical protein